MSEVLISVCINTGTGSAAASSCNSRSSSGSGGRVCSGLTAFIHHTTTQGHPSLSLSICQSRIKNMYESLCSSWCLSVCARFVCGGG